MAKSKKQTLWVMLNEREIHKVYECTKYNGYTEVEDCTLPTYNPLRYIVKNSQIVDDPIKLKAEIARLTAENAALRARLGKAVILPCADKGDWYYTVKFPARVEDEIFIINKETNSILSAAVNNIVSYDESGKEWIFSIRYDCEGCDKYGECDYFDCPSKNCIWGDMDIPHGDNEYVVGYTGVNLNDYNKTWFTDRAKAETRLAELKGGEKE